DMQSGEKGYIKLFDTIRKLEEYDEDKIKQIHKGEDFLKRLPAVKSYLHAQLLKSLRVLYSGNTISSQLKEMLEDTAILYEKRLYKQCSKILNRARELAKNNEIFWAQLEINIWQEKVFAELLTIERFQAFLEETAAEEIITADVQKNRILYRHLYNKIKLINRKIKEARNPEELKQFQTILNDPLLSSIDKALSFEAKQYFYHIHLIFNHAKGDNVECYHIAESQMKLIESFPEKISETPKIYLMALNNVLMCQVLLHKYDNFESTLHKLRTFPAKSIDMEVHRFVNSCIFEMVMYLDMGEFRETAPLRTEITEGINKYRDKINVIEEITLLYNLFYSYFGTAEFSNALGVINKLLNEYSKELRYDIQSAVRILNLILHFELGNISLLEYNAVSTYRFLYKSKRLYKLENIVLNFIRKKMPGIYNEKQQKEVFIELREELKLLAEDTYESKAFEYFDYISWLDSKIEGQPFDKIVQEKFKKKS
ncbi:MAG: hypothetical protein H0X46_08120, partial [Bacteroidetes bacterium]|nr:hypothetical protein [Bacteroidota bacterium]